ncbi:MAG TPA: hypothetical protein VH210_04700 [Gaiellaceae bacterium]|jgi:hypothetical protein|nr:hypothetical protein [Gaiellaceae bacterium]
MKRIGLALLIGLAITGSAQAAPRASYAALPSPLAPLSPEPPLGGGATASSEGFRHRVSATTRVDVSLDPTGAPFAVVATQQLDVGVLGDYFFTIGAPVLDVEAAPGSASTPGLRASSILWTGFNPGHRKLIARATLKPGVAGASLPLRLQVAPGRVTLVNATAVTAGSYTADALVPPLLSYLAQLRRQVARGQSPASGAAYVTSKPTATGLRVAVPLHVTGTVGGQHIDAIVENRLVVRGSGPARLTVTPASPERLLNAPTAGLSGRQLLERVSRASLTLARSHQYQTFLGNPDPTGSSRTTYVYRTAARPAPPPVAAVEAPHRHWATTIAVAAGLLLAAAGALFAWSKS